MSAEGDTQAANGDDGFKRRPDIERYRPGAYFNEEREKLRRRAHFGERRLGDAKPDSGEKPAHQKNNGYRRNNRGGNRGRGGGQRNQYRNNTAEDEDEYENEEIETTAPPIQNWADELSDASPEASPQKTGFEFQSQNQKTAEPEVKDLREKLNAMRMSSGGNNQHHQRRQNGENRHNRNRGGGHHSNGGNHHPGRNHQVQNTHRLPMPKRNTVNFDPSHAPADMRIIAAEPGLTKYNRSYTTRDVVLVNDIFGDVNDLSIYNRLLDEIKNCGVESQKLWQLWHGDSHVIADDSKAWKEKCPTFSWVVETMAAYFDMDVKATRLNWYRNSEEWKPFHHDAAAMKEKFAKSQNFTLGVSFGAEREAAFEHAKTKTIISMPQPNGSLYTFGRDVNILWRHGIPQVHPDKHSEEGRISIIAWGWIDMEEV